MAVPFCCSKGGYDLDRIFVSRPLPGRSLDRLAGEVRLKVGPTAGTAGRRELLAELAEADGWISLLTDRVDGELLDQCPRLRIVANYAVGFDNFDLPAASTRGVLLTNTPDVLTEATADFTWALLLALARRLVEGDLLVRSGGFTGWTPTFHLGREVSGKTLGLYGLGRIGQAVARRASGFGLRVLYHSRRNLELPGLTYVDFPELLRESDYLSLHAPLTPASFHRFGRAEFQAMKREAYLVNTARGALIDEAALAEALRNGAIAGAALDVYEAEPAVEPGLLNLPNVILAPHLGSATLETREAMAERAVGNLLVGLAGKRPSDLLNPEAWGKGRG